jgi:hypothetical protein
MITSL